MYQIPIAGGPHSGKTTLLLALEAEYPDAHLVQEPATEVIETELALQAADPTYIPRVPWLDYRAFQPLVTAKSVELEAEIPQDVQIAFQDRSHIDTIGYCRLNGLDDQIPEVQRHVRAANYAFALFCEPVGTYTPTEVRRETAEQAMLTHEFLAQAYDESGIEVIHLPNVTTEERLVIVRNRISQLL